MVGVANTESTRIVGVDVARGLAIIGMFVAHAVPRSGQAELLVDGRSSILFATLAGVSLGIVTGEDRPLERGRRGNRVVSILLRAVCLFLLGGLLGVFDSGVAVILDYYAFMFLLLTPMLFLPRWALAVLAAVITVVAPIVAAGTEAEEGGAASLLGVLQFYLLDGVYPALVWLPFLIVGLIAARSGLRRASTQTWMMVAGAASAVLGYGTAWLVPGVSAEAHSGSTAEVLGSGGVAIALIGALLWLTSPTRAGLGRVSRAVVWPIGATGSMALTVYTLQIVTLVIFVELRNNSGGQIEYPGWPLLIGMTAASLVFACLWRLWRLWLGKGPLERLLTLATTLPRWRERTGDPVR